jgi:ubiquinone/menaquinone biosynthesis C-methylase UbiE
VSDAHVYRARRRLMGKRYIGDWDAYEETMYGTQHMQLYLQMRNEAVVALLESTFPTKTTVNVLDVGQGTGLTYAHVAGSSHRYRVFGADLSPGMIERAVMRVDATQKARIARASALKLPFPDAAFDMVYATRFIHQFRDKHQVLNEFRRVTKPGGLIAVEFYARPYHWFRYRVEDVREPKEAFFSHFPTRAQVRKLVGGPCVRIPLRPAGARVFYRLFGRSGLRAVTKLSRRFPFSALIDEYFLVFTK